MKTALAAAVLSAALLAGALPGVAPAEGSFAAMPAFGGPARRAPRPVQCYDLGVDSGCTYRLEDDGSRRLVFVQHEYRHCIGKPHTKILEDGSIANCKKRR